MSSRDDPLVGDQGSPTGVVEIAATLVLQRHLRTRQKGFPQSGQEIESCTNGPHLPGPAVDADILATDHLGDDGRESGPTAPVGWEASEDVDFITCWGPDWKLVKIHASELTANDEQSKDQELHGRLSSAEAQWDLPPLYAALAWHTSHTHNCATARKNKPTLKISEHKYPQKGLIFPYLVWPRQVCLS